MAPPVHTLLQLLHQVGERAVQLKQSRRQAAKVNRLAEGSRGALPLLHYRPVCSPEKGSALVFFSDQHKPAAGQRQVLLISIGSTQPTSLALTVEAVQHDISLLTHTRF